MRTFFHYFNTSGQVPWQNKSIFQTNFMIYQINSFMVFGILANRFRVFLSPLSLASENVEKLFLPVVLCIMFYAENVHLVIPHHKVLIKNVQKQVKSEGANGELREAFVHLLHKEETDAAQMLKSYEKHFLTILIHLDKSLGRKNLFFKLTF